MSFLIQPRAAISLVLAGALGCASAGATADPTAAPSSSPSSSGAPADVNTDRMRTLLTAYSDDSFQGREAGTPGERRAAEWIASQLASIGVEPAGDSGYFQRVPVVRQEIAPTTAFTITTPQGTTTIRAGRALIPVTSLGEGAPLPLTEASGEMVFAGYGLSRPDLRREDFANLNMQDRVVVVVNGAPRGVSDSVRLSLELEESLGPRLLRIASGRPSAIIILMTGKAGTNLDLAIPGMLREMTLAEDSINSQMPRLLPMVLLGVLPDSGSPLLPPGWPNDDRAQPLRGRTFRGKVDHVRAVDTIYNIVGTVRGRDGSLRNTYVGFGAHLDHLGVVEAKGADSIANGADDDGSGTVALIEVARVMSSARQKPRRSTLFIWHTGEEKGLLGSRFFAAHPRVPVDSIVAMINADMIGRNRGDTVFIVGPGAAPNGQSRVVGAMADSVNAASREPLIFDRTWDDPAHPERIYERSDHYSYASKGVPVVFFTGPLHEDYHQVSDEVSKIEFGSLARVTRLMLELGTAIGNRTSRPR